MSLQIEEGCFYRTRGGTSVGPMSPITMGQGSYAWVAPGDVGYTDDGRFFSGSVPDVLDLVEKIEAPASALDTFHNANKAGNEPETISVTYGNIPLTGDGSALSVGSKGGFEADGDVVAQTFGPLNTPLTRATDIAGKAANLVGGDRDRQHGAKLDNFTRIAETWNAWLRIRKDAAAPLTAHDVGVMMVMMKLARTQSGSLNIDDYIDACGYAACAGEVAQQTSTK